MVMGTNSDKFDENTIYLIDSYGLIYRCYFAFISRPLTDSKGRNISALFGFFRNLYSILDHYKPKTIVAAMDSKTKTFRHQRYPEYKATRQKTPDDLHAQIPWIEEILEAMGIPVLRCDGYEADDVIATLARNAEKAGKTCRILSGDKDLMQLVNDNIQILKPDHADVWKVIGREGVKAEWGVYPEKLLDLLSLYGDTADNVPGVKGVGVKTACKYLDEYGSLEGIYQHADEIKGAIGEKIRTGKENAFFSKELITLCETVPCDTLNSIQETKFDYAKAAKLLKDYEIPAVAKSYNRLAGIESKDSEEPSVTKAASSARKAPEPQTEVPEPVAIRKNEGDYQGITELSQLKSLIDEILASKDKIVAFDTETDGLDTTRSQLLGFSLCYQKGKAYYTGISSTQDSLFAEPGVSKDDAIRQLERIFNNPDFTVIMHNGKFDLKVLRTNGIHFEKNMAKIADTMIAAWLLDPDKLGRSPYSLETLAEINLGLVGIEYDDLVEKGQTFRDVPFEKAVPYGAEDADFTWQLWTVFRKKLQDKKLIELFETVEMPVLKILSEMELAGIHLDTEALNEYNKELTENIAGLEQEIYQLVGHEFNIASTKQLQEVLFTERGLKPGKKTKTGYSTDTSVLEELASYDPVPKKILEYREMAKLQSTYVEALPKLTDSESRIHTTFFQNGTATGRLSSRDPNLQNIPVRNEAGRKIRSAFTAVPGTVLISADYSQIELVVLAHVSGDKNMCEAFNNGTDVHKATASLIYGKPAEQITADERRTAKTINFGVIYGMSAFRLSNELGISRTQASQFIDSYFQNYAAINSFINETIQKAEETGYVETIFGRRRPILAINSKNKLEKSGAERIAVNTPIQGSAADIVKKAMIAVNQGLAEINNGARLLLQVHDELILECPDNQKAIDETISLLREKMENAVKLSVPLKVSIESGKAWGEFH